MKRYIRNLVMALRGEDPFREELEQVRKEYEKTAARVEELSDSYYVLRLRIEHKDDQIMDYQALVENLRKRVMEKDDLIAEMRRVMSSVSKNNDKDKKA